MSDQQTAQGSSGRTVRLVLVVSLLGNIVLGVIAGALWDPFGIKEPTFAYPQATATPSPAPSRPGYQFPPSSDKPVDGALQCPDEGSVAAGKGDDKTKVVVLEGSAAKPVLLLGSNRRVVIAQDAVMVGPVTMCGDGNTLLIIGSMQGQVVMRGNSVKIVVQDGDKSKLPPAYSTSNGLVLACATQDRPTVPHCDNYLPRPSPKPSD